MQRTRWWAGIVGGVVAAPVVVWALLHHLARDRWPLLFAVSALAPWMVLLLPVLVGLAVAARARWAWLPVGVVAVVWLTEWGALFWPGRAGSVGARHGAALAVMTYNVLGYNEDTGAVVAAVRRAGVDVVAFQELNPRVAAAVERALGREFPHQHLEPRDGVTGGGVISRHPLRPTGEALPGAWVGTPQVLALDAGDGAPFTLVRFHAASGAHALREREDQAAQLAAFARAHPTRLVLLGDLNATDLSAAYGLLVPPLRDAWREAGWGFGHTFPGADTPGGSRPRVAGVLVPRWLVRIDHVFHSPDLVTLAAELGPHDGVSDHRPVVARLMPRGP